MDSIGAFREIADSELELVRCWRNSPNVRANMYTRHEISAEEHQSWWRRTREREDQRYFMYESAGIPVGVVAFTCIDVVNQNATWAFYAAPDARKGSGSKMEFLALEHAFDKMNLHKLYCEVLAFNTPVIKLHQKFGFIVEGIFRDQHLVDGAYVDIYRLGILACEWAQKRTEMKTKITEKLRG